MINLFFEIERLKTTLANRGLAPDVVEEIVKKAEQEINNALRDRMDAALDQAVQIGVEKQSVDFINELRPSPVAFQLVTDSARTDFSDPPFPMLDRLLNSGAKPLKDGSGVYKVIPVGESSKQPKKSIANNIFDAQKAIMAERHEAAAKQYNSMVPKGSKAKQFRTATSKQNRNTQWVLPAKEKDFTMELIDINNSLTESYDDIIVKVIRSYEEGF